MLASVLTPACVCPWHKNSVFCSTSISLQTLKDKLASMEHDLVLNTEKKERLEAEVQLCSVKLERAEKLIGGLGGEKVRAWGQECDAHGQLGLRLGGGWHMCL